MAQALSTNKDQAKKIMAALEQVGEATKGYESVAQGIRDHTETYYVKPERASYAQGAELFSAAAAELREEVDITRIFNYRPLDGAHATALALFTLYGHPGFGKAQWTMFGKIPPQVRMVNVGVGETIEVPWGELSVPDLEATLQLGATRDPERGILFSLTVNTLKKNEKAVTGLFVMIEQALREHSIYKGKAITGAEEPEFLDLSKIDPSQVIFKREIQEALEHEIWFSIQNYDLMIEDRQPTRWVSLLAGDYGTGKTLATMLTALRAQSNGITFIQCRPATDDLEQVMQTAMLYAPAVVAYEDVEVAAGSGASSDKISRMLEAFDGIRSKGADVQVILTSNRPEEIDPGLIRAGRVHTYLLFEGLDADALERLITVKVGQDRLVDLDGAAVFEACKDYSPSFMDLVIQIARRYAISRNHQNLTGDSAAGHTLKEFLSYRISTDDLVSAAIRLHPQWELMEAAKGRKSGLRPSVDSMLREIVTEKVTEAVKTDVIGLQLINLDGRPQGLQLGAKATQ